ncbi:glycosyltransferase family 32 protein [Candidatus Dependentiae bacterium]
MQTGPSKLSTLTKIAAAALLIYGTTQADIPSPGLYADFDASMGKGHPVLGKGYAQSMNTQLDREILAKFRSVYEKNNFSTIIPSATPRMPKIIHQIWLGSPVPEKFDHFRNSWKNMHPDWEYKLWSDADIEALNLQNDSCYHAAVNYGERSDIARYEILYQFGGVFADIDMECLKPIDILTYCFDFFAGMEPPADAPFLHRLIMVNNGMIGALPHHPLVKQILDKVEKCKHEDDVVKRTGPIFLTDAIVDVLDSDEFVNVVFPTSFFFPFGKRVKTAQEMALHIKPETLAVHHWAGSWIFNPKAFIPGYTFKIKVVQK